MASQTFYSNSTDKKYTENMETRSIHDHHTHMGTSNLTIEGPSGWLSEGGSGLTSAPNAGVRWNCCTCTGGGNQSYVYNVNCTECGHTRCSDCTVWSMK
ncbi:uncharacterized protein F4822DRAFT_119256 [Hypoxylon trugodes]|uniref:uncharacterized protein n=1 Tax=Hypoxylon trugodes TaxID=326681 RepID=UPI0021949562|nr:uncharacterized protein F4822DRAFT_119256 [Hypoxylon trugodes]KAI1392203.1 hypothetical protein F4822DRAFT_119256 [Hypoxylon trugodes]